MRALCLALLLLAGCSNATAPRPLGDSDASKPVTDAAPPEGDGGPCGLAAEGCPCTMPGQEAYCGKIYRKSGDKLDCELGYAVCQADGGYGPCIGAVIFDPGD